MSSRPIRAALAVALAAAATLPAVAAEPFSRTVFFGDSLTDSGYFRPVIVASPIGASGAILGRFTTNPGLTWAEHVADRYGANANANGNGQFGDNYAVGGARVSAPGPTALGPAPSLASQVNTYLTANGGRADADALYSMWGGANDLFAVAANPAQAQQIIGSAVTAQVGIVGALQGAGARYVVVPSIPDIGLTPRSRAGGAVAMAQGTALTDAYNTALYRGLASQGLRVIPVDTFHFLQEVTASPALYGLANVTSAACRAQPGIGDSSLFCNPNSLVTPSAADTYLFADGVHPASRTHAMIADLAIAMIDGPQQIAVLPQSATVTGRARADRVNNRLSLAPARSEGRSWWTDVRADMQRYDHGDAYDGTGPALTVGLDWTSGDTTFGGFVGYGKQGNDWGLRRGNWDQTEATVGGFVGWRADSGAWVNAQLSYTWLDFDTDRTVQIGPMTRVHAGQADGSNVTAAIGAGWNFGEGALQHGPVLSLVAQRIEVEGFAESEPTVSSALAYPSQDIDSLIGSAGWQFAYAASDVFRPYARLTVDREFQDAPAEAWAQAQSLPSTLPYAVPARGYDPSYATATLGMQTKLFGLDANIGASLTIGQKGGSHTTAFATLGAGF